MEIGKLLENEVLKVLKSMVSSKNSKLIEPLKLSSQKRQFHSKPTIYDEKKIENQNTNSNLCEINWIIVIII